METRTPPLPPKAIAHCGPECACAEALRGLNHEWRWCRRPGTAIRVVHETRECRGFFPRGRFAAPAPWWAMGRPTVMD